MWLASTEDTKPSVEVVFCDPAPGEVCCISMEPIENGPAPDNPLQTDRVLQEQPFTCIQVVPCSHRFEAVGLIAHFVLNSMTCPLCRAGTSAKLDLSAEPFQSQPWAKLLLRGVSSSSSRSDVLMHMQLCSMHSPYPIVQLVARMLILDEVRQIFFMGDRDIRILNRMLHTHDIHSVAFKAVVHQTEYDTGQVPLPLHQSQHLTEPGDYWVQLQMARRTLGFRNVLLLPLEIAL